MAVAQRYNSFSLLLVYRMLEQKFILHCFPKQQKMFNICHTKLKITSYNETINSE